METLGPLRETGILADEDVPIRETGQQNDGKVIILLKCPHFSALFA